MFVWAQDEYLWIMKINFVWRVRLELVADFRVGAWLVFFQAFYKIFSGLSNVKRSTWAIETFSTIQQFFVKDRQRQLTRSNVVYRLNCSGGSFYIGQTRKNLVKRLEEHQSRPNSEVCNQLQSNPSHKVDFHNPQILTLSPDKHELLILESLCIQLLKRNLNLDSSSYPLHLFNAWKTYRPILTFHCNQSQDVIRVSFLLFVENGTRRGLKRSQ